MSVARPRPGTTWNKSTNLHSKLETSSHISFLGVPKPDGLTLDDRINV